MVNRSVGFGFSVKCQQIYILNIYSIKYVTPAGIHAINVLNCRKWTMVQSSTVN